MRSRRSPSTAGTSRAPTRCPPSCIAQRPRGRRRGSCRCTRTATSAEAALVQLSVGGGGALVFAVGCCADWVPEVRDRALRAVRAVAGGAPRPAILLSLAVVDRLAAFGERRTGSAAEVRGLLAGRLSDDDLLAALDHYDMGVRRACTRLIVRDDGLAARALPGRAGTTGPVDGGSGGARGPSAQGLLGE